ncbi:MAG: sigma-70 family RNA polymerase sigma factor [Planctomycetota bacterium]|jgi:RNA polymerase sigma-70 factor (ECF subfamily)
MNLPGPNPSNPAEEQVSDEALVNRARSGDRTAFDTLVLRYQDRVFNMSFRMLGNREDALDVSQEVLVTAYRSLGGFQDRARFSTWLYRITVNRCRDELRRRQTVKHTRPASLDAGDDPQEPAGRSATPDQEASARELAGAVERAIAELPEEVREALVLRDTHGLNYEQIAEACSIPVGTVRSRLNRARTLLREELAPLLELDT